MVNGTRFIDCGNTEENDRYSKRKGKNLKPLNAKKKKKKNASNKDEGVQLGANEWKLIMDRK